MQRKFRKQILVINIIFCVESTSIFRLGVHKDNSLTHKTHRHSLDIICVQAEAQEEGKTIAECIVFVMGTPPLPSSTHFKT